MINQNLDSLSRGPKMHFKRLVRIGAEADQYFPVIPSDFLGIPLKTSEDVLPESAVIDESFPCSSNCPGTIAIKAAMRTATKV
jgi:hypothetical protein